MQQTFGRASLLGECARIAGRQHGVITREQATALGLSKSSLHRLTRSGFWHRMHQNVYALWTPPGADRSWLQGLIAAALWLGPGSAASHRAGGVLWDVDGIDSAPVELSTTGRRRSDSTHLVVHRVSWLPKEHIVMRSGIPVTCVERTLLDLAAVTRPLQLELALESVLRRKLTTLTKINEMLRRAGPTVAGRGVLRALLDRPTIPTESALETILWEAVRVGALPEPARQYPVHDAPGRVVARIDFAYPDARLAIEADGFRFHSSRRDWERDRARGNALVRLGWIEYRVTWADATKRRSCVVKEIACLLAARLGNSTAETR